MKTILNQNPMLINFLLATFLITLAIGLMISLDTTSSIISELIKKILQASHRSKLLTEYILRAYIRYRKTINKPLLSNSYQYL